jgi:putative tryptophan/tyrosine transport system substrate-binding protein
MRRRKFIALLGSVMAGSSWLHTVRAQQSNAMRRIAVVSSGNADDQIFEPGLSAFRKALHQLGWADGRNVSIDLWRGAGDLGTIHKLSSELSALAPEVIVSVGGSTLGPLLQATATVPIVFVFAPDPFGSGFVKSLARPGGNATGFMAFEYSLTAKWLELLKQIAPEVKAAAVLWDPAIPAGIGQLAVIQSMAPSLGMEPSPINFRNVEQGLRDFASSGSGGLIVTVSGLAAAKRDAIIALAAQYKLPAVYPTRGFVNAGGLISYGADLADQFRLAARYVDRILKGEKPADLPVQAPTKYELVINLKTAQALGVPMPPSVLARADEVIE